MECIHLECIPHVHLEWFLMDMEVVIDLGAILTTDLMTATTTKRTMRRLDAPVAMVIQAPARTQVATAGVTVHASSV